MENDEFEKWLNERCEKGIEKEMSVHESWFDNKTGHHHPHKCSCKKCIERFNPKLLVFSQETVEKAARFLYKYESDVTEYLDWDFKLNDKDMQIDKNNEKKKTMSTALSLLQSCGFESSEQVEQRGIEKGKAIVKNKVKNIITDSETDMIDKLTALKEMLI